MSTLGNIIGNSNYTGSGKLAVYPAVDEYVYQDTRSVPTNLVSIDWTPDGHSMLGSLKIDRTVYNFTSTASTDDYHINTRSVLHNYRYGFIPEIASGGSAWAARYIPNTSGVGGKQLLIALSQGTSTNKIQQYTMPFAYDLRQGNPPSSLGAPLYPTYTPVSQGAYNCKSDTSANSMNGLNMSPDGTRLLAIFPTSFAYLAQWNLTVPYNVLGGMSWQTPVQLASGFGSYCLYVPPKGDYVYLGKAGVVQRHALSTPWDISTFNATAESTLDISAQTAAAPLDIYATKSQLYVLVQSSLFEYEWAQP